MPFSRPLRDWSTHSSPPSTACWAIIRPSLRDCYDTNSCRNSGPDRNSPRTEPCALRTASWPKFSRLRDSVLAIVVLTQTPKPVPVKEVVLERSAISLRLNEKATQRGVAISAV